MKFTRPLSLCLALLLCSTNAFAKQKPEREELDRDGLSGSYLAGRMASSTKDLDASATYLGKALALDPKNMELQSRTFVVMVAAGRISDALGLYSKLADEKDTAKLAQLVKLSDCFHRKAFDQAIKLANIPARGPVSDITSGLLAAWALAGQGKTKAGIALLDRLTGPSWYATFRDYHAGLMASLGGDKAEADKRFAAAYVVDSKFMRIVEAYAVSLAQNNQKDKALQVIGDFLKLAPSNSMINALKTQIENGTAPLPLAKDAVQGASEVMFGLGSALAQSNGDELAAIYLQLSLYMNGENALTLIALADLYDQLKQPDRVIEILGKVPETSPLKPAAELQLAIALDEQDKTDEAMKHLDALIAKNGKNIEAVTTKANLLRVHKNFAEAQQYYEKAVALLGPPEKRNWALFYFRGMTYERNKIWDKAEADLKKALELQPDQPSVLNYLGYSWIDRNMHLDEAMGMLKRAVQQDPNNGYVVDSVGWAYYRMGQYDEAVSWLERAISKKASDPVINDHLGDAYWKAGRQLEAHFQWSHAKDLKPEPEDLARINGKLARGLTDDNQSSPSIPAANIAPAQPATPSAN